MSAVPGLDAGAQPASPARALVGPNAVTRLAEALSALHDDEVAEAVFARAGVVALLRDPPAAMVDEVLVAALYDALFALLPIAHATAVATDAGARTASYLLVTRIPAPARALLRALPAPLAARGLLAAVARNAWTFAGSGCCRVRAGQPLAIIVEANPIAMPGCPWHAAVFGGLFQALV